MTATLIENEQEYKIDLDKGISLAISISNESNLLAWYVDAPRINAVKMENWTGAVQNGASTNFNAIYFNPHAHGTHTECLGHITKSFYNIQNCLQTTFFVAQLISVMPILHENDWKITKELLLNVNNKHKALVIRTLPNEPSKTTKNYCNTNPPYLTEEAALYIKEQGIEHLLIDLPSVDKEKDGGALLAHKAFWNVKNVHVLNDDARKKATITEFIFVPDELEDGIYILNLQIAPFNNDATPSQPILYRLL